MAFPLRLCVFFLVFNSFALNFFVAFLLPLKRRNDRCRGNCSAVTDNDDDGDDDGNDCDDEVASGLLTPSEGEKNNLQ